MYELPVLRTATPRTVYAARRGHHGDALALGDEGQQRRVKSHVFGPFGAVRVQSGGGAAIAWRVVTNTYSESTYVPQVHKSIHYYITLQIHKQ